VVVAAFPNMDSNYLFSAANPGLMEPYVLMATIEGRLPITPAGLTTDPRIGDPNSYEGEGLDGCCSGLGSGLVW
jgi:hypothetical protein